MGPSTTTPTLVLGIDAAWTPTEPSGVALVTSQGSGWRCLAVAPSYAAFDHLSQGIPVAWTARPHSSAPSSDALLTAVERLAGRPPDVIAIDMPLSHQPITKRRAADDVVSRCFSARHCAAHSPNATRPGPLSDRLRAALELRGFALVTAGCSLPALIEVYPHIALLQLFQAGRRLEYKASKARKYWKGATVPQRIARLLEVWQRIVDALAQQLGPLPFTLPRPEDVRSLSALKRYEDALDALVCAYVGVLYATKKAEALGDATGAIWAPQELVEPRPDTR